MKIPQNHRWTQTNDGNIHGVLHETHNMNFDRAGDAILSRKSLALVDSSTSGLSDIMAIVYFDGDYILITDDKVFRGDLSAPNFTQVSSSPTLGTVSDGIACFSRLYVSDTTALAYMAAGGAWTTGIGSLTSTYPHPLAVFDFLPDYKLAVGDGYQVRCYDSSGNAYATVLALPQNYIATSLAYRNGFLFVATKEINGGEAAVFMWNGDGTDAQYKVDVGAAWIYSIAPYRGSVACVTNEGELLLINGASVQHLAAFPVYYAAGAQWDTNNATRGKVYQRGMTVLGDLIYININGSVDNGEVPQMKTGIWCFDPAVGLYHHASPTTDLLVRDSGFTVSSSTITTSATHNLERGDAVTFSSVSGITGISNNTIYYAIPQASNTFSLAACLEDTIEGLPMTISGTRTTDILNYGPNTDYGQMNGNASGAIVVSNYLDAPDKLFASNIIFSSEVETPGGTSRNVLCVLTQRYNRGCLSTQRIYTNNINETWKSVYTYVSGLLGPTEKGVVKSLSEDRVSTPTRPIAGTWATTTTIVTTDFYPRNITQVGDEVQILDGYGQGKTAHVTAIETSATTTSLTLDEAIGTVGSCTFRLTGFTKIGEIAYGRPHEDWHRSTIDTKKSWVQVKVELRGYEPSVPMLELTNTADKSAV